MKILEGTQTFTNRGENAWNMTGKKSLYYNMTNLKICIDAFPVIILRFHPAFYPSSRSILPRKCSPPFTHVPRLLPVDTSLHPAPRILSHPYSKWSQNARNPRIGHASSL